MNKLIIAFIFCAFTVQAQVENDTKSQETKTYYWFYLRLSNLQGNNSSMSKINLSDVGNEIISGSFDEFTKDHENGLKSGKVIVGPFLERQHA